MAILKSVPGIEVSICVDNEPLIEHTDRSAKAERSTVLKYVEVVPDKDPYIVLNIMVDGVDIRTLPFGRQEFEQDCQASSSHVHECIGSHRIEDEQEVVSPFKFSKFEELRDEIENDVSHLEKTGEVKVGLYRAKSVKKLSATQARKYCPTFWKQPELNNHLMKDVHWDAISGRLESQSHMATLGPAKPAGEDPWIRNVYDIKYMDFDRSRSVKPQGVFKLRYRSKGAVFLYDSSTNVLELIGSSYLVESLKALLVIRWDDAAITREPIIKIESDDEGVVEDVAESIVKRERDEDFVESSMPAAKRARPRRNKQ
ncbi:uncharacterized protein EAE98_000916 [Botrytis deweyae]|uniref:DUF7918 domain-containing protein n=1 Tax=Botrytis deweyae TaxID=2478750 RepID=A0ABQ7IZZ7_9HELO|nr:uncharacterized protein EAE98_000916 [Botrytis deweyae]KAF7938578.1 hypothetical protein EAE98_000916 [Botrytis deweyae]